MFYYINLPLCGHIFSLFFIREHFQQSSDCPLCRTTVPDVQQVLNSPSPVLLRNILGKLTVTCPFKCGLICQRMNLASHLQICTNALVLCPNNDNDLICGAVVTRADLTNHLESCDYRQISCPHERCELIMTAVRMPEHISSCSYRKIECENVGCGVSYCFIDLDEHKSTCPYERLTCLMSLGDSVCKEVVIRKDFAAHQHECPLRPVTCPNGCGCIMSVRDEKSHSCIKYLSQGMQAMAREMASLRVENGSLQESVLSLKGENNNMKEENITLRQELDAVRLLLVPLQLREEEYRRREEEEQRRREEEEQRRKEEEEQRRREEEERRRTPEFLFTSPFDTNGVLYYIGTEGRTTDYMNPHIRRQVVANRSSSCGGNCHVEDFVGRDIKVSGTHSEPLPWLSVDLGYSRSLQVQHYCLRQGQGNYGILREWNFEGSNDGVHWNVLRQHSNDTSIGGTHYEGHWEVINTSFYRFFRVIMVKNSFSHAGSNFFVCCGIELYGKMALTSGQF